MANATISIPTTYLSTLTVYAIFTNQISSNLGDRQHFRMQMFCQQKFLLHIQPCKLLFFLTIALLKAQRINYVVDTCLAHASVIFTWYAIGQ